LLRSVRLDKETWRVAGQGEIRVQYDTYWDDAGPFGTQLNRQHAFVNPAMVLCYVPNRRAEDVAVHFADVPQGWRIAIELPKADAAPANVPPGEEAETYTAANFDALADAPVEIGTFDEARFTAAGRPIRLVIHGDDVNRARLQQTLTKIVEYETRLMGDAP